MLDTNYADTDFSVNQLKHGLNYKVTYPSLMYVDLKVNINVSSN